MGKTKTIHCCCCDGEVEARLTTGREIYPMSHSLKDRPFWLCDECGNYVGCHYKMKNNPTQPLGCIPTPELRNARKLIHQKLDPIWKSGRMTRKQVYAKVSEHLGWQYHTANLRTIEEARKVYRILLDNF